MTNLKDKLYWYRARVAYDDEVSKYSRPVVDGDSVYLWLDKGLHDWQMQLCRLSGIDAPERGEEGAEDATTALSNALNHADTIIVNSNELGKYGRPIVTIYAARNGEWVNVNDWMIQEGHAEEY